MTVRGGADQSVTTPEARLLSPEKIADLRLKNLEMVQAIVARMAGYSATLKNYCITLTIAIAGFAINAKSPKLLLLGFTPIIVFALLDARYLRLERQFRCIYDIIRTEDWSSMPSFEIKPANAPQISLTQVFRSWAIVVFYLPLALALVIVFFAAELF